MTSVKLSVDDPEFVDKIIFEVKSQGHFDAFRKECLADVDTQPAFQNLHSRVEDSVQKFLIGRVWTPETNKNKLREEMRHSIIRAGYLENGVSRIVDQVMEQKMNYIQSKVEEILYKYVGIEKPVKKEKTHNGSLEIDTDLLPTDLEQVSPDSDKKSSDVEVKDEEIEEEIVEDFESPAFEPIEAVVTTEKENSNLSAISGLTSQDSLENKEAKEDTQLSQISSIQDISQEAPTVTVEEVQEKPLEKSQFDLQKDTIEFTGTERKSITLDDSTNSGEAEKVLQPQDVPSNTMEIDNLYENDTTDSSEMRMEIDLKDETTQETGESSKVEESSQDSSQKHRHHHHHKSKHKSSSSHKSSRHHHHSSSSRHGDDKYKSRSSSSSHKKGSSSSSRRDHEKEKEREKDKKSSKKDKDDHYQEKSSRRRSTDHDSNDGKKNNENPPSAPPASSDKKSQETQETKQENKAVVVDAMLTEDCEISLEQKSLKKSSILVKYDYLKSPPKAGTSSKPEGDEIQDGFLGFSDNPKLPENPWFNCLRNEAKKTKKKTNNNYLDQKSLPATKVKTKQKSKSPDSPSVLTNGSEEITPESRAQTIAQQQRYTSEDLFKPRFHFGNRNRRRGQATEEEPARDALEAVE